MYNNSGHDLLTPYCPSCFIQFETERYLTSMLERYENSCDLEVVKGLLYKNIRNNYKIVYCVLFDGHLWILSLLDKCSVCGNNQKDTMCHSMIKLTGALITTNDNDDNKFQIKTKEGEIHYFQACTSQTLSQWTDNILNFILKCHENYIIEELDTLIENDTNMRSKRYEEVIVRPLYNSWKHKYTLNNIYSDIKTSSLLEDLDEDIHYSLALYLNQNIIPLNSNTHIRNIIVKFGMYLIDYKEMCQKVQQWLLREIPITQLTDMIQAPWKMAYELLIMTYNIVPLLQYSNFREDEMEWYQLYVWLVVESDKSLYTFSIRKNIEGKRKNFSDDIFFSYLKSTQKSKITLKFKERKNEVNTPRPPPWDLFDDIQSLFTQCI